MFKSSRSLRLKNSLRDDIKDEDGMMQKSMWIALGAGVIERGLRQAWIGRAAAGVLNLQDPQAKEQPSG